MIADVLFWVLAAALVVSAIGVVTSRNLWRAAYWLAAGLVTTSVFYMALTAPLLAAVQILLYTGGVLTLVVYALVVSGEVEPVGGRWRRPVPALVLAALVFAVLATQLGDIGSVTATAMARPGIGGLEDGRAAGIDLFTRYLVPFELLSVLLLGAIFGALAIARREERS